MFLNQPFDPKTPPELKEIIDEIITPLETNTNPEQKNNKIRILQDIQIVPPRPTTQKEDTPLTAHSTNTHNTVNDGIPILDEIINNKPYQMIITKNPYNKTDVSWDIFEKHNIWNVKIPKSNQQLIFDFLKNYTADNKTFYLYFYDDSMYSDFNNVYMTHFYKSGLKLIKCTKLVNTIKDPGERTLLIKFQHEGKQNHRGISETLEKLKQNYYWPSMKNDISKYVNDCEICQTTKYSRKPPYVPLVLTETVGKPFQLLHIDIFRFDNQDFLTIIDTFSKLGQALPIHGKTAIEISTALIKYFSFYGLPERIIMDNGPEFKNETVRELLKAHKINIHFTTPFHHESNSPIERFHSTLIEHLRILNERFKNENVKELMQYALIAYNNSIHSATRFTPFDITFGHTNSRDPCDLINTTFYADYILNHKEKLKHLYQDVKDKLETNKLKIIQKRNTLGPDQYQFKVGQTVYKTNIKRNKKDKKFIGPFEIVELLDNNKVKIKNKTKNKEEVIHIKELKSPVVADSSTA